MTEEIKTCAACNKEFIVSPDDKAMYESVGAIIPDNCPICNWKHLFAFWRFGKFRKGKSALSGKPLITMWPEDIESPIYTREEWASDKWDPLDYGVDYDSGRPFFEQFAELQKKMPITHQTGVGNTNSDWSDDVWWSKNCYLCRAILHSEDLRYCYRTFKSKFCVDLAYCFDSEFCYDSLYCFRCYKTQYAFNSRDCIDSKFLYDCRNLQNCFMCWNLRNKEYCIQNKQYTKEEYEKKLTEFNLGSYEGIIKLKQEFDETIARDAIHRQNFNTKVVNSTGNFLTECRNCHECYFLEESENCRYIIRGQGCKDSISLTGVITEKSSVSNGSLNGYMSSMLNWSVDCHHSSYLDLCENCENCFGCIALKKKKYCILNKQYSKEEYNKLLSKIMEDMKRNDEWGKFFPLSLTRGGYNFSTGHILFPDTEENIERIGGLWEKVESVGEGMSTDQLPDDIKDVKDDIVTQPLICSETGYRFNIASNDLQFYRQYNIPLPRQHPDFRTLKRFGILAKMLISQKGNCHFCDKEIIHYYPSELGYQKIACIECYQKEVV
ncbi:MAG: hypothetical protein ABH833_01475 [Parcubacteria group bacterium]